MFRRFDTVPACDGQTDGHLAKLRRHVSVVNLISCTCTICRWKFINNMRVNFSHGATFLQYLDNVFNFLMLL